MRSLLYLFTFCLSLLAFEKLQAQNYITYSDSTKQLEVNSEILIFQDDDSKLTIADFLKDTSLAFTHNLPRFTKPNATYWIKLNIINNVASPLELIFQNPLVDYISFYKIKNNKVNYKIGTGDLHPYFTRPIDNENFIFNLSIANKDTATYYLQIKSKEQIVFPITISTPNLTSKKNLLNDLLNGIYFGLMVALLLYNFFISLSTEDKSYIFYLLYVLFFSLTQAALNGYTFKYFWPADPLFQNKAILIFPSLAGITAIIFSKLFLNTRKYTPLLDKGLYVFLLAYSSAIVFAIFNKRNIAFNVVNFAALTVSIYAFIFSIIIAKKGFRPAKFFLIAWSFLLTTLIIYAFRNLGLIPGNLFSNNILQIGSGLEALLLSFALADKINTYRKEKEIAQEQNIRLLEEKQETARLRAIELTRQVDEKTAQLSASNLSLSTALQQLKETQSQMVQAEKMASLGQLTAGVAHEINNPINFVKSNVAPLKTDIGELQKLIRQYEEVDWKGNADQKLQEIEAFKKSVDMDYVHDEIDLLMKGIEEGANRTIDIVKGLRIFSRLDEGDLKQANVQEGIDSTLVLLRNALPKNIEIVKEYGDVQMIECYPGKLNQVFMNILNNAVYAIKEKNSSPAHEEIIISTYYSDTPGYICIGIKDTGMGIKTEVKEKIFDPFFTTKEVGEGTGLGLSIVFSIIENHKGKIIVNTEYEKGTEFIITLPTVHKTKN